MNETDMLQGTNFNNLNQNGFNQLMAGDNPVVSDSTDDSDQEDSSFKASFLDWIQSVSGANFYKNISHLFTGKGNDPNGFWDFVFRDPDTGYSQLDFWKSLFDSSRVGKLFNDMTGSSKTENGKSVYDDGDIYNDIPRDLIDIFKQGLDLFNRNSENQQTYNAEQAREEREWARLMRQTAYQDTMADLKAAGINPLLAFSSLGPTSIPSGAAASSSLGNSNSLFSSMAQSVLGDSKLTMSLLTALLGIFRIFTGKTSVSSTVRSNSTSNSTNHNYNYNYSFNGDEMD